MWEGRLGRWTRRGRDFGSSIWAGRQKFTDCGRLYSRRKGSTSEVAGCALLGAGWARVSDTIWHGPTGDAGWLPRRRGLLLTSHSRGWVYSAWGRTWKKATPLRNIFCRNSDSNMRGGKKSPDEAASSISTNWRGLSGSGDAVHSGRRV